MATKATQQYRVLHNAVDSHYQGAIITEDDLRQGRDVTVDIDRLLRLGAIAPITTEQAKALEDAGQVPPTGAPIVADSANDPARAPQLATGG